MGIKQNFDKNMKKALKKVTPTLPPDSKFIFQQLLKNSHHIEENLEDETMVEYKIGDLRKVIRSLQEDKKTMKYNCSCVDNKPSCGTGAFDDGCEKDSDCKDECDDGGLKNTGRGDKAIDSMRLSEKDIEIEMDEVTSASSSGSYETPKFWAKGKKNHRFATKRWMPDSKYVKVKDKCKKFPYCNQGDINALEIWEKEIMRESVKNVSKKTGKPESEVREMIEKELAEVIRRSFYKSPIKDLVGGGKMGAPIGKIFTMKGNKPKYES